MSTVAVATCAVRDVDPDSPALLAALADEGVAAELAAWDDPEVDWGRYDLVVVRSTWDYTDRRDAFLAWARSVPRIANAYPVLEYSSDKHYLAHLASRGVSVVPSTFCDVGDAPAFPDRDFVVKPCVGAGAIGAERYGADELDAARAHVARLHGAGRDVLIQPYVASVDDWGERALVFIDGAFSHALTKGALLNVVEVERHGLYRQELMSRASAEPDALVAAATAIVASGFDDLTYARVDLVELAGEWALIELELVEPSLFLAYDDVAAVRLARAIARRAT